MSIDSLKRVLMATKEKARGMRKNKLENRMNPKAPALAIEIEAPAEAPEGEESMDSSLALKKDDGLMRDASPFAKGMSGSGDDVAAEAEGEELSAEGPPSEDEKAAALEEIRALLARV